MYKFSGNTTVADAGRRAGRGAIGSRRDPIAIVGVGCRLPRAANVAEFWNLLIEEREAITDAPARRFGSSWQDIIHRNPDTVIRSSGGFLDDVDKFDAEFFGISTHAAIRLDPKCRLLMETTWEALEDAGIPADRLAGSNTGVYTCSLPSGYWELLRASGADDLYGIMGAGPWQFPAGRISHQFDLRGPSMGIEATCATALLGVHLACRALWSNEIDLAIVGGVNVLLLPDLYPALFDAEVLSPAGRCKFGDADADGYVRSEAVVSVVLKPMATALDDGDQIYAAILGTAATNDGRSGHSLVAPGIAGQEAVLRAAYRDAGIPPGAVDYVEAHGPGTPVGDSVELTALSAVLRDGRKPGQPCLIGSAKSNLGHSEVAAGLVGLVKTALAVRHRTIPATLHVREPNPVLREADSPLALALSTRPWPERDHPILAGISSFGVSGTNVHVVLGAPPPARAELSSAGSEPAAYLLPLSAQNPRALAVIAEEYADMLTGAAPARLRDVCFSASVRRTHHDYRLAVVGADSRSMADTLRSFGSGGRPRPLAGGRGRAVESPRVVFVFPGHSTQWIDKKWELLNLASPTFMRTLHACARAIEAEQGWSPIDALRDDRLPATLDKIQPTIWAIQVAIAALWRAWGIEPDLIIGHSMGEVAAATASGALTLRDGAAVICRRSRLLEEHRGDGAMWAVQLGEQDAQEAIREFGADVCVGVINSDHFCVLSGTSDALARAVEPLRKRGVFCRQIQAGYASHAPQVEAFRPDLLAGLADVRPRSGRVPIHSTVWDREVDGADFTADYWMANLRLPVRFAAAIKSALSGPRPVLFVEISPHPLLLAPIEDAIDGSDVTAAAVPSAQPDLPMLESMLTSLGTAYVLGGEPNWRHVNAAGRFIPPPGYPWQRTSFWVDPPVRGGGETPEMVTRSTPALAKYIGDCAAEILAVSPDEIDLSRPLTLVGLDSILAVRLAARLRQDLDIRIRASKLLGSNSPHQIADDLRNQVVADMPLERAI
jgi:acyl transferase domain-containing protein